MTNKSQSSAVQIIWDQKIPVQDGVELSAIAYLPTETGQPVPAIVTMTPYMAQSYHDRGLYFAANGYLFYSVDVRGRGNSEGTFEPFLNEGRDGCDVVEWVSHQPRCNGKVSMWGGSYAGLNQWNTAKLKPPHLASIVPAASVYIGLDFPMRNNITWPYLLQWLTLTAGRTIQDKIFNDHRFWRDTFWRWYISGRAFKELPELVGIPSALFKEWILHQQVDPYWKPFNPTPEGYANIKVPVLSITGSYDNAQRGALMHHRSHVRNVSGAARDQNYLVIGPWDHAGTRDPQRTIGGVEFGERSRVDLQRLHYEWYSWTMVGATRPAFLKKNVAYYVAGEEEWRYSDTLDEVTGRTDVLYLSSPGSAAKLFGDGKLTRSPAGGGSEDSYVYDPSDFKFAALEVERSDPLSLRPNFPSDSLVDQSSICAQDGRRVVYHSEPFEADTEVSGHFKLTVWISIDQPDTDFCATVYAIDRQGDSILLASDNVRARHRNRDCRAELVQTTAPLRYEFTDFNFTARLLRRGSGLRLVIGPVNSIYFQKNYNSGKSVWEETLVDARPVIVKVYHNAKFPSALYVPIGTA